MRPLLGGLLISLTLAGCWTARQRAVPPSPSSPVIGVASWYGPGFNGRRTANGEIYNQEDLTAASNTFPLGTRVIVTNLDNGRSVEVRINDRGPFLKGRKIDLSHRAAKILGIVDPGTARVRIEPIGSTAQFASTPGYYVQVGSFADVSNARRLRDRLAASYRDVSIEEVDAGRRRYYRVRMGSFVTRDQALARAGESAELGLPIIVVGE